MLLLIQDSTNESIWLITLYYQISSFQLKPLATIRRKRETAMASQKTLQTEGWRECGFSTAIWPVLL